MELLYKYTSDKTFTMYFRDKVYYFVIMLSNTFKTWKKVTEASTFPL